MTWFATVVALALRLGQRLATRMVIVRTVVAAAIAAIGLWWVVQGLGAA